MGLRRTRRPRGRAFTARKSAAANRWWAESKLPIISKSVSASATIIMHGKATQLAIKAGENALCFGSSRSLAKCAAQTKKLNGIIATKTQRTMMRKISSFYAVRVT